MTRSILPLVLLSLAAALLPGCRSLGTGGGTGAVVGSALGTAAGYAIGNNNGEKWAGAGVGAVVGGLAGYLVGESVSPSTHERPIEGPTLYRADSSPAARLPAEYPVSRDEPSPRFIERSSGGRRVVRERVIVREIYSDGTVHEREVVLE